MQYASNVDIDLSRMCQGAPIETLSKVHRILFNGRLVFTNRGISSLNLQFVLSMVYLTKWPLTQSIVPQIYRG